jgi:hypothetical protein
VRERLRTKFKRDSKSFKENEKALINFQKYKGNFIYCVIYGHRGAESLKRLGKVGQNKRTKMEHPTRKM